MNVDVTERISVYVHNYWLNRQRLVMFTLYKDTKINYRRAPLTVVDFAQFTKRIDGLCCQTHPNDLFGNSTIYSGSTATHQSFSVASPLADIAF